MSRFRKLVGVIAVAVLLGGGLVVGNAPAPASAANAADFDAGNIISDDVFFNGSAMSSGEVQNFLNGAVPRCDPKYVCLKGYVASTPTRGAVAGRCATYQGSARESAADIIAKVGAACGISQKALIVLLEKEQSLITDSWPSDRQYRSAMGFGCPDTADCDSEYYGFFNQVYAAALQFKNYAANPTRWNHVAGRVNAIRYHPNAACGSSNVYIANQATAGLYNYTPYQPNASALANLYGQGDGCGAYGNRNFWRIFTDWFGSTTTVQNPVGALDEASVTTNATGGTLRVRGWTLDLAHLSSPLQAHIYVTSPNGAKNGYPMWASQSRPDIAAAYPGAGAAHGYSMDIPVSSGGSYQVCVFGIGFTNNRQIGCSTLEIPQHPPKGELDAVDVKVTGSTAAVSVRGWSFDEDSPTKANAVHVYATRTDGRQQTSVVTANGSRPDVGAAYPSAGANHGYSTTLQITDPGLYNVCAYGIGLNWRNVGANKTLGCRSVNLISAFPSGWMENAVIETTDAGSAIKVSGWTVDTGAPDASIPVHVYITDPDGATVGSAKVADKARPDVNQSMGVTGAHGFQESFPITKRGDYRVCSYGVAVSPLSVGKNATLGCRTVTLSSLPVTGALDEATISSTSNGVATVTVRGWALDRQGPSTSIPVHIYVYGPTGAPVGKAITASGDRPDIAKAFPGAGAAHGFQDTVQLPKSGSYQVCAFAIGTAPLNVGNNPMVGCRTVSY